MVRRLASPLAAALSGFLTVAGYAQGPTLAMLDRIEPGRWEVREHGSAQPLRTLCLASARRLVQLRHSGPACESYVVEDGVSDVTVQYTCRGHGYGRTHIRRESSRLLQLESQGIVDGFPFEIVAEARRVGDCTQ
jgi:hypothetical protein